MSDYGPAPSREDYLSSAAMHFRHAANAATREAQSAYRTIWQDIATEQVAAGVDDMRSAASARLRRAYLKRGE